LRVFHDRYFSPERVVLTIVSDVPAADIIPVLNATFGRMKRYQAPAGSPAEPARRAADSGAPPVTAAEKRAETQTGRAQSQILTGRIFTREGDDFPALVVATTV